MQLLVVGPAKAGIEALAFMACRRSLINVARKHPDEAERQEWRRRLITKINRCDASFNPDTATICSRHFKDDCFLAGELLVNEIPSTGHPRACVAEIHV